MLHKIDKKLRRLLPFLMMEKMAHFRGSGGEKITAVTDHKPLGTIPAKRINSALKRLPRVML